MSLRSTFFPHLKKNFQLEEKGSNVLVSAVYQHTSAIGIHTSSPSWNSLLPHHTPLDCHRAPDLSPVLYSKFHWISILHTVIHISIHSLHSSHPPLPPLCPQVCPLRLHLLCTCVCVCVCANTCMHTQSFRHVQHFCDSLDYSLLDSFVHRLFQARILEWGAMPSSRGSSQPWDQSPIPCVSCSAGRFFTCWAISNAAFYIGSSVLFF